MVLGVRGYLIKTKRNAMVVVVHGVQGLRGSSYTLAFGAVVVCVSYVVVLVELGESKGLSGGHGTP